MGFATAVALGTTLYGMYSANESRNDASSAMGRQEAMLREDAAYRKQMAEEDARKYGPLESQLIQKATGDQPLHFGPMSGQIQRSTAAAERSLASQMAARGMGGSGLQAGATTALQLGKISNLAAAFQSGLQAKDQLGLGLLNRYQPMQNAQYVSGAAQPLVNLYGAQADLYNQAAQQEWQGAAQGLSGLAQWYDNRPAAPATPTTTQGFTVPQDQMIPLGSRASTISPTLGVPASPANASLMSLRFSPTSIVN